MVDLDYAGDLARRVEKRLGLVSVKGSFVLAPDKQNAQIFTSSGPRVFKPDLIPALVARLVGRLSCGRFGSSEAVPG